MELSNPQEMGVSMGKWHFKPLDMSCYEPRILVTGAHFVGDERLRTSLKLTASEPPLKTNKKIPQRRSESSEPTVATFFRG